MREAGLALLAGGLTGGGLAVLTAALLPPGPPDLPTALARLSGSSPPPGPVHRGLTGRVGRVCSRLAGRLPRRGPLTVPAADLRLLGQPVDRYTTVQAGLLLAGLAAGPAGWALLALAGAGPPPAVPGVVGPAAAAVLVTAHRAAVRARASRARADFRRALSAYLDLVALERAGRGSPIEALEAAAEVGHGWAFTPIRERLRLAARSGASPYRALGDLADEVGVAELRDLADITAVAADGAAVYATLLAGSRSLRHAVLADDRAAANAASERLVFPVLLLGAGFLLLLFYPAVARILA